LTKSTRSRQGNLALGEPSTPTAKAKPAGHLGQTIEAAKLNIREAVQEHLKVLLAHGEHIPSTSGWFMPRS
jgi:hypothetical protein